MLRASDVLTPAVGDALRAVRLEAYLGKARTYLRDQFPCRVGHRSDTDLDALALEARRHARARGFDRDSDLLAYLVPVCLWGLAFETDLQHRTALQNAGWLDATGAPLPHADPMTLAEEIDHWKDAVATDLADPNRAITAFRHHFLRDLPDDDPTACEALMGRAFPARAARLGPASEPWVRSTRKAAQELGLKGADLVGYVALALYFGYRFAHDPLYPWAQAAYLDRFESVEAQRLALGAGIQNYVTRFGEDPDAVPDRRKRDTL